MCAIQKDYTIETFEFEKGDYLRNIEGSLDYDKHFVYL